MQRQKPGDTYYPGGSNHNTTILDLAEMICLLLHTTSTQRYLLPLLLQVLSITDKLLKYGLPRH